MDFTKEQLSHVFVNHRERGLQDLMKLLIEGMMRNYCKKRRPPEHTKCNTTLASKGRNNELINAD